MRIAIYSRKSKYTGKGDSIGNQIKLCKEYIDNKFRGENVFSIFEDEGFSGKNLDRPSFKDMFKRIKNNEFDILICYRLDRISRNVSDFSSTLEVLQEHNVSFISITENFDTSTSMGRAMIYIASTFAQLERETIAERIKDNMIELAKNGKWSGGKLPAGYKSEREMFTDEQGNKRSFVKLVQVKEDVELVKLIYDTYLKVGSLHKTEVYFIQNNIKSTHGVRLEKTTLKVILQNPLYVKSTDRLIGYMVKDGWTIYGEADNTHGLLSYNKTKTVSKNGKSTKVNNAKSEWFAAVSNVEGFLDDDTWIRVQEQFKKNKGTFPALGKTHNALLTGKIFCGNCNSYMIISHGKTNVKGEKLFYYSCSLKKTSHKKLCSNSNAKTNIVDKMVIQALSNLGLNKSALLEKLKANLKAGASNELLIQKRDLNKELELIDKQINNLVDKLSIAEGIEDILIEKIKKLKDKKKVLSDEIVNTDLVKNKIEDSMINLELLTGALDKCSVIETLDQDSQKKIINVLIDKIYWYGEGNNKGGKIKIELKSELMDISEKIEFEMESIKDEMSHFKTTSMCNVFENTTYNNCFKDIEVSSNTLINVLDETLLSSRIKLLRSKLNMTQREFANYCDIGYQSVCKYEIGYNISKINKIKICNKLNIDIAYLEIN